MELTSWVLFGLLILSIISNVFLFLRKADYKTKTILLSRENESLRKTPAKQESYEATELLRDILAGEALVRVTRISPSDVLLRSPRS